MRLEGKVAIITGGARGIGEATAIKFINEGAKVVIADINEEDINNLVDSITTSGGEASGLLVDVTKENEVETLMAHTVKVFGKIDIVINNAGITKDAQLLKMDEKQWDDVINVNLKGVFNVGQAAARIMKEQQYGVIINASSVVGTYGNFGQTNYAATKWGVNGMTKTWSKELGKYGVRVNAIAPGFILTSMTQKMPEKVLNMLKDKASLKRMGTPEEVANGYAFLASDEAAFITGEILAIDGGVVI